MSATRKSVAAKAGRKRPSAALPNEVRIVGGDWKRSKLRVLDRPGLRPTPDRVRETLYNWLGQRLDGWRCLDAFAGSGALGFEAASRGAAEVVLLERDGALHAELGTARERLGAAQVRVERADAVAWMSRADRARFDLVLLDPPFGDAGLFDRALAAAAPLVAADGFLYLEGPAACPAEPFATLGLRLHRDGRAGAVHFYLARRDAAAGADDGGEIPPPR